MLFLYDGRLNDLNLSIAKQIDANPKIILENNIFGAAQILGISASKLTKYCQKIKLKGFKEIKFKIDDEIRKNKYAEEMKYNIDIKSLINSEYYNLICEASTLILKSSKIIVITDDDNYTLACLMVAEFRRLLAIDVVCYYQKQEFDFEYLYNDPCTIFLDERGSIKLYDATWYRPGNKYVHFTNQMLVPRENYYPVSLTNAELNYTYHVKIVMIIAWLKKIKIDM